MSMNECNALSPESDQEPSSSKPGGKRAQVKLACNACRARKTKCTGKQPCARCERDGIECAFDDRLHLIASLRQDREGYKDALNSIYQILREGLPPKIRNMQNVASNTTLNQFISHLRHPSTVDMLADTDASWDGDPGSERPSMQDNLSQWQLDDIDLKDRGVLPQIHFNSSQLDPTASIPPYIADNTAGEEWNWLINQKGHSSTSKSQIFGNLPLSSAVKANNYPSDVQNMQVQNLGRPEHHIRSMYVLEDCTLSDLFATFTNAAMEQLSSRDIRILGGADVDVELFFRDRTPNDPYNVFTWGSEIAKALQDYDIFVLLAMIWQWGALLRWTMLPTADHYAAVPEMIRPLMGQRMVPHNVTIDLEPHFAKRKALLHRYRDWLAVGAKSKGDLSVEWNRPIESAVQNSPDTGRRYLTNEFLRHVSVAGNWSMNQSAREDFPEIEELGFRLRNE